MTPERWNQIRAVFEEAQLLASSQRVAFLDEVCASDRELRHEVESLLEVDSRVGSDFLDGGATEDGVPYLVMELIEGDRIDAWCQANRLSVTERLRIFLQVCSAVEFAHQHLVIHRDIKPGNILVTDNGAPKLLDFGIA